MTSQTILIAAFSGRSLAQSAERAGYVPLVADAFGDLDTRAAAHDVRVIDGAMQTGFRAKPLIAALNDLIAGAPSKPVGLVLGSGFEDKPRLVDLLNQRFGVIGCSVEALTACKDPLVFFPVLDELGLAHPETRITPPDACEGWITKRVGGSGGRHIRDCTPTSRARPRRYFQKRIEGERISVSAIVADGIATDMTRQWCSPAPGQSYRYGGAVSIPFDDTPTNMEMLKAVDQLARGLELRGLVSFDFIVANGTAYLLEINPRPGASLDVIDTVEGSRFHAHIEACKNCKLHYWGGSSTGLAKAASILHADRGALTLTQIDWPDWAADRGAPGTHVPLGAPLATVFAQAETPDAAVALAASRLAELESLIYESRMI